MGTPFSAIHVRSARWPALLLLLVALPLVIKCSDVKSQPFTFDPVAHRAKNKDPHAVFADTFEFHDLPDGSVSFSIATLPKPRRARNATHALTPQEHILEYSAVGVMHADVHAFDLEDHTNIDAQPAAVRCHDDPSSGGPRSAVRMHLAQVSQALHDKLLELYEGRNPASSKVFLQLGSMYVCRGVPVLREVLSVDSMHAATGIALRTVAMDYGRIFHELRAKAVVMSSSIADDEEPIDIYEQLAEDSAAKTVLPQFSRPAHRTAAAEEIKVLIDDTVGVVDTNPLIMPIFLQSEGAAIQSATSSASLLSIMFSSGGSQARLSARKARRNLQETQKLTSKNMF